MDVEAKPAIASGNVEIEAAVAEVQVPRGVERIVDGAHDLPIAMHPNPNAADIAIGGQREAVAEVAMIARADQRIEPLRRDPVPVTIPLGSRCVLGRVAVTKPPCRFSYTPARGSEGM